MPAEREPVVRPPFCWPNPARRVVGANCHVRIAFAPNQIETAELLSKMTGTATVQKASFNFSGSRFALMMSHVNASVDHIERPLMTPDEIMRLRPPKKEGDGAKGSSKGSKNTKASD